MGCAVLGLDVPAKFVVDVDSEVLVGVDFFDFCAT